MAQLHGVEEMIESVQCSSPVLSECPHNQHVSFQVMSISVASLGKDCSTPRLQLVWKFKGTLLYSWWKLGVPFIY